ncbi:TPA: tetratricopeptide repeat protein [Clostridioides difficile]|nr:tetratricopeptide repeat protein [Clostridioides difficile]
MNENEFSIKQQNNVNGNNVDTQINYYQSNKEICHRIVNSNSDISVSKNFTGRKEEMNRICKLLDNNKNVLISGMGGIGKTEIFKNLYHKYNEENFDYLVYLNYENTIDNTIMNSILRTQISDNYNNDLQSTWNNLSRISNNKKAIIFIDNMNKTIKEDPSLKKLNSLSCSILITSRNKVFQNFEVVDIDFMEEGICKDLFLKTCVELKKDYKIFSEEEQLLDYIIKKIIFRHTQTIILLSHIMIDNCWNINELKENILKEKFNLEYLKNGIDDAILIEEYKKLFTLSNLKENKELDAINVLEAFSIFPYIPLPIEICNRWLLEDAKKIMAENKSSCSNMLINKMYRKGWLQSNEKEDCFYMHPIISQTILSMNELHFENHINLIKNCSKDILKSGEYIEKYKFPFYVFAKNILNHLYNDESIEISDLYTNLISIEKVDFEELEKRLIHYKKRIKLIRNVKGDILKEANTYNNIGVIYENLREFDKAIGYCEKALDIFELNKSKDRDINLLRIYGNLSTIYSRVEKHKKALYYCKKELKIAKKILNKKDIELAYVYKNIGFVNSNLGDDENALDCYKNALEIGKTNLEENHIEILNLYNNITSVYINLGEYEKALNYSKKMLNLNESREKESLYHKASSYNNISSSYKYLEEYEKAVKYGKKAKDILIEMFGTESIELAYVYNNLGTFYLDLNQKEKALEYLEKALKIFKSKYNSNHMNIRITEESIKKCKPLIK